MARYWEPRRLLYNALLLWATLRNFEMDGALGRLAEPRMLLVLVGCAMGANLAYCAAYLVDLLARRTPLERAWLKTRWILFVLGCWLALLVAYHQTGAMTGGERMA